MNVYDSTGRKLGQVNEYGTASEDDGYKVGDVGEDGALTDNHEEKLGKVSEDGTVTDSNDRTIGNVAMSMHDTISMAGGAALLLLLKPKQELA